MKFRLKNDEGIELYLDLQERELLYDALRHYSAYGENQDRILDQIPKLCEILNVLDTPAFSSHKKYIKKEKEEKKW